MKTRDRILATALELFNAQGASAISTNHIAEAMKISPGNLYYHFRSKEAIVHALFEQLFAASDALFVLPSTRAPTLADLLQLVEANFRLLWEYRFVYRELIVLLRRDDELRARFLRVRQRGYEGFHELIAGFVAAGVLRDPGGNEVVGRLADLCWLISEQWLPTVEIAGQAGDAAQFKRGVALMVQVLEPFIVLR
jgi:AcrR family transcriptional regulator